jgi:hypothetical protein
MTGTQPIEQPGTVASAEAGGGSSAPICWPIRVFPYRTQWTPTDELAFVGEPPLWRPGTPETPVHVSVTFTWHKAEAERIAASWRKYYKTVLTGGPAYEDRGGEYTTGMYLKEGCTITSRGCTKKCAWCVVPTREGAVRELAIKPGWIVQDSNLLACSEKHIRAVFDMLRAQKRRIYFNGGLDKHFLKEWHRELFDSIRVGELWWACDVLTDLPHLERAAKIMKGYKRRKMRCYTMIGYNGETIADAETRLRKVWELGFLPFTQLYQSDTPKVYATEWRNLRRTWSRPAAMYSANRQLAGADQMPGHSK